MVMCYCVEKNFYLPAHMRRGVGVGALGLDRGGGLNLPTPQHSKPKVCNLRIWHAPQGGSIGPLAWRRAVFARNRVPFGFREGSPALVDAQAGVGLGGAMAQLDVPYRPHITPNIQPPIYQPLTRVEGARKTEMAARGGLSGCKS